MQNYKVSDTETNIERYQSDEVAIIRWCENGIDFFEIQHIGYTGPSYRGCNYELAREASGLSHWNFQNLLFSDPDFLEVVG